MANTLLFQATNWKDECVFEVSHNTQNRSVQLQLEKHCTLQEVHRWIDQYLMQGLRPRGRSEAQVLSLIEQAMISPSLMAAQGGIKSTDRMPAWAEALKFMQKKEHNGRVKSKRTAVED